MPPKFFLGSVAQKVSQRASSPVLVTRVNEDTTLPNRFNRVVVGVDYSPASRPAAQLALSLANRNATVELVHVWDDPYQHSLSRNLADYSDIAKSVEYARSAQAVNLEAFASELSQADQVELRSHLGSGKPAKTLLERAKAIQADLIVVGAHERTRLSERVIGTVADRVLRHADTPVLFVPEAALHASSEGSEQPSESFVG